MPAGKAAVVFRCLSHELQGAEHAQWAGLPWDSDLKTMATLRPGTRSNSDFARFMLTFVIFALTATLRLICKGTFSSGVILSMAVSPTLIASFLTPLGLVFSTVGRGHGLGGTVHHQYHLWCWRRTREEKERETNTEGEKGEEWEKKGESQIEPVLGAGDLVRPGMSPKPPRSSTQGVYSSSSST